MNQHSEAKKQPPTDWHRADIVAALWKAGWSLRRLSISQGYAQPGTLTNALDRRWPKGEQIIADAIGVSPATVWPTRYPKNSNKTV